MTQEEKPAQSDEDEDEDCPLTEDEEASDLELAAMRYHYGILQLSRVLTVEKVDTHRRGDCKNYEMCLDYACKRQWRSFSCFFCDGHKPW